MQFHYGVEVTNVIFDMPGGGEAPAHRNRLRREGRRPLF